MSDHEDLRPDTRVVTAGRRPEWTAGVVNTPVWRASNDLFYFFDPTPGVAKPWRLVTDKSTSYTEEAARTTPGSAPPAADQG